MRQGPHPLPFHLEQAEAHEAVAHLTANRGKTVMGLDEGLAGKCAGLGDRRVIDDRRHGARRRRDVRLGPDLTFVIRIFAGADRDQLVTAPDSRSRG
jgi:hypothetical protein